MQKTNVTFFESDSAESLDTMISGFINKNEVQVINVSITSSYNPKQEQVVFCVALAFLYEE